MQTLGGEDEVNVTASQRQSHLMLDNLQLPANIITLHRIRLRFKAQAVHARAADYRLKPNLGRLR